MKKMHKSDFPTIEAVLVLIVVGIIGFTGWFVWNSKQKADKSLDAAKSSEQAKVTAKEVTNTKQVNQSADEKANWLVYTPPGKEYTVRLADGWNLQRYQKTSSLNAADNNDLAAEQGTKAVVTQIEINKGARTGFFLNYATQNLDQIYSPGTKQADLKTVDGLAIEKYEYVENDTKQVGLQAGDTQYTYIIRKGSNTAIVVTYSFELGSAEHTDIVEKVVQTLHFN